MNKLFFTLIFFLNVSLFAEDPISAQLSSNHTTIVPGQEFQLLLDVELQDGWHAYWKNPGDAGIAPSLHWKLPEGLTIARTDWPTPEKFEQEGILTYGYAHHAPFLITIKASKDLKEGSLEIEGELEWVVCSSETCLPGTTPLKMEIQVGKTAEIKPNERFAKLEGAFPEALPTHLVKQQAGALVVLFPKEIALADTPHFFPEDQEYKKIPKILEKAIEIPLPAKGVLVVGNKAFSVDASHTSEEPLTFLWAILFALVGGLILNLMPCVLPVVSLKVMSFVKMSGNCKKAMIRHGIAFTGGVLLSFWVLAALLIGLQATGQAVGWGFQLQDPLFIGALALLFTFLALNLFGVFELGTSIATIAGSASQETAATGYRASFWSGIFATAVATPCTGPFMGSALGYALSQPVYISFAVFTALGLGMSLPYLAIGFFPSTIKWIPKPGPWMESFKQFLGFIMLAAVIWLLWVFIGQTSELGLFLLLLALLVAAIAGWVYGRFGALHREKMTRKISYLLTALLLIGSIGFIRTASLQVASPSEHAHAGWEPFSVEKVAALRQEKKPILIDFTAKWCLICQANHLVMSHKGVVEKFQEHGVTLMKADWTRYDPVITEALKKYGRSGVPLYVLYGAHEEPTILPQVLTPEIVMNAVEKMKETYVR